MLECDVLIIGSGAGGGPLALTLASAGVDVLVLEKGPRHPRAAYRHDELEVIRRGFFTPRLDRDPHTVVTASTPRPQLTQLGWIASCVGGGTAHMGAYLYRFHPDDLRMASRFGGSADQSAADGSLELADWPFDYAELEPWYGRAERELGLAGDAGANPFEGRRSEPYPMPPLRANRLAERLERAARGRGVHAFPTPRAVNSEPYGGRPACSYCEVCAGYGCPTGARGTSQEALLPRAEATGRCRVLPQVMVTEITLDDDGRAAGCLAVDGGGEKLEVRARRVCLCASAVESARLLLLSTSDRHPRGLGNRHGLVGRHLQFHAVTVGQGLIRRDRLNRDEAEDSLPFLGRSVMDHYFLPEGVSDLAKGGLLRFFLVPERPLPIAEKLALGSSPMLWGRELYRRVDEHLRDWLAVGFEAFHDFLPNRGTYVTLDPDVRDAWGLPVARIHLEIPSHHRRCGQWLLERAFEILGDMGAERFVTDTVGGTSSYLVHGTCRAGHDPADSVLDAWCRVHDVPGLYVVDGSFMPTSGGASPTLTIVANSFRVGHHITSQIS